MRNYISNRIFGKDIDDLSLEAALYVELTCRKMFYKTLFFISVAGFLTTLCIVALYI